jgi:hypothetical protein
VGRQTVFQFTLHFALVVVFLANQINALQLIDEFHSTRWGGERGQVINCLGLHKRFNKRYPAGHGNKLVIPRGELASAFVFKMLKIPSAKTPNRERKTKIPQREGGVSFRDVAKVKLVTHI